MDNCTIFQTKDEFSSNKKNLLYPSVTWVEENNFVYYRTEDRTVQNCWVENGIATIDKENKWIHLFGNFSRILDDGSQEKYIPTVIDIDYYIDNGYQFSFQHLKMNDGDSWDWILKNISEKISYHYWEKYPFADTSGLQGKTINMTYDLKGFEYCSCHKTFQYCDASKINFTITNSSDKVGRMTVFQNMCSFNRQLEELNILFDNELVSTTTNDAAAIVDGCTNLKIAPKFKNIRNIAYAYQNCKALTHIGGLDGYYGEHGSDGVENAFMGCTNLETIDYIVAHGHGENTWKGCESLKNVQVTKLGNGDIHLEDCMSLSSDSVIYMLTNAQTQDGTTWKVIFHENIRTMFDDSTVQHELIESFFSKGWEIYFGDAKYELV